MTKESSLENIPQYKVGDSTVYRERVWEIKDIRGDEAEIYAPKSEHEITAVERRGETSCEEVARQLGGVLEGEPYVAKSPNGESFTSQKVVFPEETKRVKLTDLLSMDTVTS